MDKKTKKLMKTVALQAYKAGMLHALDFEITEFSEKEKERRAILSAIYWKVNNHVFMTNMVNSQRARTHCREEHKNRYLKYTEYIQAYRSLGQEHPSLRGLMQVANIIH